MMFVTGKLNVTSVGEKSQALRDLANGLSNKYITVKYGVSKNAISASLMSLRNKRC